ncbi:hypothetical protein DFJ74DRAFT_667658 [Hyaloraphidium curvatum]|nr:hypothetical protein DFJ74DRAFT_667658 [Hyaloraphidium curvatum]
MTDAASTRLFTTAELRLRKNLPVVNGFAPPGSPVPTYADVLPTFVTATTLEVNRPDHAMPHALAAREKGDVGLHVSADSAQVCFTAVPTDRDLAHGQYHMGTGKDGEWAFATDGTYNQGGFDAAVVDSAQPGTVWQLSVRLIDFADKGIRVGSAWLARPDFVFRSCAGEEDQSRGHLFVGSMRLESGKVAIHDEIFEEDFVTEGQKTLSVKTGLGDGLYPVKLRRDTKGLICAIEVDFFPKGTDSGGDVGGFPALACRVCGVEDGISACSECHSIFYCGPVCQTTDWMERHHKECKQMRE